ncbi:MAG: hypothetical protein LBU12_00290 [Deltaproteobacteria bacterium]|nr:hypothetical protein [Deltaproteobacteria bacterium]
MGAGQAEGPGRAAEALRRALSAPLMAEAAVGEAAAALVRISAGPDLLLDEFAAVNETVADLLAPEADLFSSVTVDEELGRRGALKVVVMAAGLGGWRRSAGPDVAARRPVEAVVEPAVEAAVEPDRNLGTRSGQAPGQKPVQELVREPVREPLRDEERDAAGESIRDSFQAPLSETAAETAVKAPPSLALEATSDLAPASAAVFGAAFELALEASRRRRRRRRATGLVVGGRRRGDGGCGPRPELTLVRPGAGDRRAD